MAVKFWQIALSKTFLFCKGIIQRQTLGARVMLVDGNKVLLIKHSYLPFWQFPGGGVDPGETFENTMRRELFEETGYEVIGEAQLHGIFHNTTATNRDHLAFYIVKDFKSSRPFKPSREIIDMKWFDVKNLPDEIAKGAEKRIAEIFEGKAKSLTW